MKEPGQIAKWFNRACNDAICDEFGAGDCTCAGFLIQARADAMREAAWIASGLGETYAMQWRAGGKCDSRLEAFSDAADEIEAAILSAIGERQ